MESPNSLIETLSQLLRGPLNSVEILPGGLLEWKDTSLPDDAPRISKDFPFVLVEGNLGIPKKVLYAIYLSAVATPWRVSGSELADDVSSLIILANAAHQTALNTRKRLIDSGYLDPQQELDLCELMARGSPEFGKQSIVWAHRRRCFSLIYGKMGSRAGTGTRTQSPPSPPLPGWASSEEMRQLPRLSPEAVQRELRLIQHTCETYPRNYHAWAHWHHIIDVCYASFCARSSDKSPTRIEWSQTIQRECARLGDWINLHVSDYSAMHQLALAEPLLEKLHYEEEDARSMRRRAALQQPLTLVEAFPSHESLWMYLRAMLGSVAPEKRDEILGAKVVRDQLASNHYAQQLVRWFGQ